MAPSGCVALTPRMLDVMCVVVTLCQLGQLPTITTVARQIGGGKGRTAGLLYRVEERGWIVVKGGRGITILREPAMPPSSADAPLAGDALDLLRIIHELVSAGGNPCFQDLADEMDLPVGTVAFLVRALVQGGWIEVPVEAALPIRVLREPEMPVYWWES